MRGGGRPHGNNEYSITLRKKFELSFDELVTKENLYRAWNDFVRSKRKRVDVNNFSILLADNLFELHDDLLSGKYQHGAYEEYMVCDPKKRIIHKASVRDRVVHRLVYNALYSYFDSKFFYDSYSCRVGKGTHKARARFRDFVNQASANYTKPCYILKFDIKKCFASVDQGILKQILQVHINDDKVFDLLANVVDSFPVGLPLGNLTSQLFINIYLHELDYHIKQTLGVKYYLRYADDIVIVGRCEEDLRSSMVSIRTFLENTLRLQVHKIIVCSVYSGVDVVGEVFFPTYTTLRQSTVRRARDRVG